MTITRAGKEQRQEVKTKHMREDQDYKIKQEMTNKTPNHDNTDMELVMFYTEAL